MQLIWLLPWRSVCHCRFGLSFLIVFKKTAVFLIKLMNAKWVNQIMETPTFSQFTQLLSSTINPDLDEQARSFQTLWQARFRYYKLVKKDSYVKNCLNNFRRSFTFCCIKKYTIKISKRSQNFKDLEKYLFLINFRESSSGGNFSYENLR